jgi:hypothetical protein
MAGPISTRFDGLGALILRRRIIDVLQKCFYPRISFSITLGAKDMPNQLVGIVSFRLKDQEGVAILVLAVLVAS